MQLRQNNDYLRNKLKYKNKSASNLNAEDNQIAMAKPLKSNLKVSKITMGEQQLSSSQARSNSKNIVIKNDAEKSENSPIDVNNNQYDSSFFENFDSVESNTYKSPVDEMSQK